MGGNYVAALLPNEIAGQQGHPITLFLDSVHHRYIEEFNSSNFVAVTKEGTYITPASESILPRFFVFLALQQQQQSLHFG